MSEPPSRDVSRPLSRASIGLFGGAALGAGLGALIGLVVASLINSNCDTFIEQAEGCTRADVHGSVKLGAIFGAIVLGGLCAVVGGWLDMRRHSRTR